jgi:hypothetical protein
MIRQIKREVCLPVVAAHGGTARALVAILGAAMQDEAVYHSIDQGVVYVFAENGVMRYG